MKNKQVIPSENFKKSLDLLYELDKVNTEEFHLGVDLFSGDFKYRPYDYLNDSSWFENDLRSYFKDQFIEFAGESDGSKYCLWYYPGLIGEPPVVYIGSDDDNCTVAPSMKDFICLLIIGEKNISETKPKDLWECVVEEMQDEFAEIIAFKKIVNRVIECNDYKTIIKNFKKQPKFHKWVKKVEKKDLELQNN